jgi:hypothetical protein
MTSMVAEASSHAACVIDSRANMVRFNPDRESMVLCIRLTEVVVQDRRQNERSRDLRGFCKSLMGKEESGRGERIRTSGLYVPNVALYQAKLHPDFSAKLAKASGVALADGSLDPDCCLRATVSLSRRFSHIFGDADKTWRHDERSIDLAHSSSRAVLASESGRAASCSRA